MAKPTPKQNFLQTALLMVTIYMGMMLFFNSQKPQTTQTVDQLYGQLKNENSKLLDQSAMRTLNDYNKRVDDEVGAKRLTRAEADSKKIEAAIISADTQLKAGISRSDSSRIRSAYQALIGFQKKDLDKPEWNRTYSVADVTGDSRFGWKEWTGQQLYTRVVSDLSARNRTDLIWGTIPGGFQFIDFLVHLTGAQSAFSYAFAGFLLALCVRSIIFPLAQKQIMFGRQMSQLAPLAAEIKEKYKDEPQQQQAKVMELYKEYGINPLAGCLPAMVQMPLFLTVYQCMLHYQFEFQKGTFLWINPTLSKATGGIVAPNLGQLDYILIVIYGISMIVSTLLMPVSDPSQIRQQRMMGVGVAVFFTISMFFGIFPTPGGFVLYWIFTNLLATAQSLRAYRLPLPALVKVNAAGGGVFPVNPSDDNPFANLFGLKPQKPTAPTNGHISSDLTGKTGTPAKHKPKKRK